MADAAMDRSDDAGTVSVDVARACAACGGRAARPLYCELVRCETCGMVYYPRVIVPGELQRIYGVEYFEGAEYFNYLADRAVHEANFAVRVRQLARWLPAGNRLFEIGCAYGFFLNLARQRWSVAGCDIAEEPCHYARQTLGLEVFCGDFCDAHFASGGLDAVCLWDTIEHLDQPEAYLRRIAAVLKPGGLLALTTGDAGSWLARWRGPRWRQIHPPSHLWYFSRATMRRCLERFGFEPLWFRHVGFYRSVGQIVYSLASLGRASPSRLSICCKRLGLKRALIYLNTFDTMMVVARRPGPEHDPTQPLSRAAPAR